MKIKKRKTKQKMKINKKFQLIYTSNKTKSFINKHITVKISDGD